MHVMIMLIWSTYQYIRQKKSKNLFLFFLRFMFYYVSMLFQANIIPNIFVNYRVYSIIYPEYDKVSNWILYSSLICVFISLIFIWRNAIGFGSHNWIMMIMKDNMRHYSSAILYFPVLIIKKVLISALCKLSYIQYSSALVHPLYIFICIEIAWLIYIKMVKPFRNEYANRVSIINSI